MSGPLTIKLTPEEVDRFAKRGSVVSVRCGDVLRSPKSQYYLFCCNDSNNDESNAVDERQLRPITDVSFEQHRKHKDVQKPHGKHPGRDSGVFSVPSSPATEGRRQQKSDSRDKMAEQHGESSNASSRDEAFLQNVSGVKEREDIEQRIPNQRNATSNLPTSLGEALTYSFIFEDNVNHANEEPEVFPLDLTTTPPKKIMNEENCVVCAMPGIQLNETNMAAPNGNFDGGEKANEGMALSNDVEDMNKNFTNENIGEVYEFNNAAIVEVRLSADVNPSSSYLGDKGNAALVCAKLISDSEQKIDDIDLPADYLDFVSKIALSNTSSNNVSFANGSLSSNAQEMFLSITDHQNETVRVSIVPYTDSELSDDEDAERSYYQVSEKSLQLQELSCKATIDNDDYVHDSMQKKQSIYSSTGTVDEVRTDLSNFNISDPMGDASISHRIHNTQSTRNKSSNDVLMQENTIIVPVAPTWIDLKSASVILNTTKEIPTSAGDVRVFHLSTSDMDSSYDCFNLVPSYTSADSDAMDWQSNCSENMPDSNVMKKSKDESSPSMTSDQASSCDSDDEENTTTVKRRCGYTIKPADHADTEESWYNLHNSKKLQKKATEKRTVDDAKAMFGKKGNTVAASSRKRTLSVDSVGSKGSPISARKMRSAKSKIEKTGGKSRKTLKKAAGKPLRKSDRVRTKIHGAANVLDTPLKKQTRAADVDFSGLSPSSLKDSPKLSTRQERADAIVKITDKKNGTDAGTPPKKQTRAVNLNKTDSSSTSDGETSPEHSTRRERIDAVANITDKKDGRDAGAPSKKQTRAVNLNKTDSSSTSDSGDSPALFDRNAWRKLLLDTDGGAKATVENDGSSLMRCAAKKRALSTDTNDSEPPLYSDFRVEDSSPERFDRNAWKKLKLNDEPVRSGGGVKAEVATLDQTFRSVDSDTSESYIDSYVGMRPASPKYVPPFDDWKLLDLVGLRILKDLPNFKEQSSKMQKRSFQKAKEFAELFGQYQLIWRTKNRLTKNRKELQAAFETLQLDINQKFRGYLNLSETKRLVNLVLLWYRSECVVLEQMNNKVYCDGVRPYFNLFKFVPQTVLRTYYCEYCPMQLRSEGNYFGHRLKHIGQTHYICKGCLRGFMRFKSYIQHEEICPYQDSDEYGVREAAKTAQEDTD